MALTVVISPSHVREVIQTSYTDAEIEGLIATAVALFKSRLGSSYYDPDVQVEILRWLTAHYISVRGSQSEVTNASGGPVVEEKIGDASVKYASSSSSYFSSSSSATMMNLKTTFYGQQAISLDHTGRLSNLGGKPPYMAAL